MVGMTHVFTVTIDENGEVIDIEPDTGVPKDPFRTLQEYPVTTTVQNVVSLEIIKTASGCIVHLPGCRYRKVC